MRMRLTLTRTLATLALLTAGVGCPTDDTTTAADSAIQDTAVVADTADGVDSGPLNDTIVASDTGAAPDTAAGGDTALPADTVAPADTAPPTDTVASPDTTSSADTRGAPDTTSQDTTSPPATSCTSNASCSGHPAGEYCIPFVERCGRCRRHSDCPTDTVCNRDFECGPRTDAYCATHHSYRPWAVDNTCVECRDNVHCPTHSPFCTADNTCRECLDDDACVDPRAPHCVQDVCTNCATDDECPEDTPQCTRHGCEACDPLECPASAPRCLGTACVACYWSRDCDGDDEVCVDNACVVSPPPTSCGGDGDCTDEDTPRCHPSQQVCVECSANIDCQFDFWNEEDVCQTSTGRCVECLTDSDCHHPLVSGSHCDTARLTCHKCLVDAHCPAGEACRDGGCRPACFTDDDCDPGTYCNERGACKECLDDAHCADVDGATRCRYDGRCAACTEDAHCAESPAGNYCAYAGVCAACTRNVDCAQDPAGAFCVGEVCGPQPCYPWGHTCDLDMVNYVCGTYGDLCGGTLDCGVCGPGGACVDGGRDCACPPDGPDSSGAGDAAATAFALGELKDSPDSALVLDGLSVHTASDEDWYVLDVKDAGIDGNPLVRARLTATPVDGEGDDDAYVLTVWLSCQGGTGTTVACKAGRAVTDPTLGTGCTDDGGASGDNPAVVAAKLNCAGTVDDSGTVLIHARKSVRVGRCDSYSLSVEAQ